VDREYKVVYANRAARQCVLKKEAAGEYCYALFHGYDEPCAVLLTECSVRTIFETGVPAPLMRSHIEADNKMKVCEITAFPISLGSPPSIVYAGLIVKRSNTFSDERLVHIGKMAALGTMLIHIVHNLNSSMYVINNYVGAIERKCEKGFAKEDILENFAKLNKAVKYGSGLTTTLLDYMRSANGNTQKIYLKEAIEEITDIFSSAFTQLNIKTELDLPTDGVLVDRQSILTVLFCMIQNALEAMDKGGTLSIFLKDDEVTVGDTGKGISEETKNMLFKPFFTTSPKGTGLGLYITKLAMDHMGGGIAIESREGEGTKVKLLFKKLK
jgi:C4-dicarboxylate-specific signal transduction histidine kinase